MAGEPSPLIGAFSGEVEVKLLLGDRRPRIVVMIKRLLCPGDTGPAESTGGAGERPTSRVETAGWFGHWSSAVYLWCNRSMLWSRAASLVAMVLVSAGWSSSS